MCNHEVGEGSICGCEEGGSCTCGHGESGHEREGRGTHFRRRYRSKSERINDLSEYLRELEAEAQGVREYLDQLRSDGGGA